MVWRLFQARALRKEIQVSQMRARFRELQIGKARTENIKALSALRCYSKKAYGDEMNYDEKIRELQRKKAAKEKADRDAEGQADRRAFWRKIALMAVLSAVFLCLLMVSGMWK
jgi:hypothetical protein